jgi:single-strand selective monofunctional uracil DNA glycosylase
MVQTGVPFGEIAAVRDWMGIEAEIVAPAEQNPKRPIEGFACTRSEVSGRRLWGLFAERFGSAEAFFAEHFVANYCPLAFLTAAATSRPTSCRPPSRAAAGGLRRAPAGEHRDIAAGVGDRRRGVGRAARPRGAGRAAAALRAGAPPQPASPAANRGWSEAATRQLVELGCGSGAGAPDGCPGLLLRRCR